MANLGTLWFGADIDITALKNKINQGNQSILDALKMNYDPASYTQMVSKLKSELAKETFEIKIDTNAQQIRQQLNQTVNSINNTKAPNLNFGGINGIHAMTNEILNQRDAILDNKKAVQYLKEEWGRAINQFGRKSVQAMSAFNVYDKARTDLRKANWELESLNITKGRASLSQKVLNEQMREAQKAAKQWDSDHMRLNATLAGGIHVSTQLGSALSSLFAIDAARQFLGYVIEIGGQLEKQRISIGAILGDTVKANHLFEQIKGLALKSPFGVVELDQYTKQLSAYGFKYNELYDMTKRLADISAGAGQDIGRLTLALGHVRSATYLTGITLRQFSMNNIPMLKMLADYYSEVEKRAVSTAEVQQRISKRQVSYEDVIEQIRRLTDEGGMFYNMQEKISESLAAKFKNLKDAMDIMYGEMAEGFVGDALKSLANVLLKTTRHWKEIAAVMGVAAAAFMYSKIKIGLTTATMQGNTAATLKQIMADKQLAASQLRVAGYTRTLTAAEQAQIAASRTLTASDISMAIATKQLTKDELLNAIALKEVEKAEAQALVTTGLLTQAELDAALATDAWKLRLNTLGQSIKRAFMGIGTGTLATIGLMVGTELYMAWEQWNQRIDDKSKEMKDIIKSRIIDLQKMQKSLESEGKPKDSVALKARISEMKQVLADSEAYTKTIDEQLTKTSELPKQYDILAESIENVTEKNKKMLDAQDNAALLIKASKSDFKLSDWPKSVLLAATGNYSAAGSSLKKIFDQMFDEDIVTNINDVNNAYKNLRNTLESLYEFKEPLKELIDEMIKSSNVSEGIKEQLKNAPFEEQLRILAENGYWDKIKEKIEGTGKEFDMTEEQIKNTCERLKSSFGDVADEWGEIADNDIKKMFNKLVEIRGGDEKEVKKWALDNIEDVRMLLDGVLDQANEKEPAIRRKFKSMFLDLLRFGVVANELKNLKEGAEIGASMFTTATAKKLLDELEAANITEDNGDTTDTTKGDKKDKQLEAAKTKLQQYKAFLSEYKKYREIYSKEKAINLLEKLFPELKGQGANLVDNYTSIIDALITKLVPSYEKASEARKKLYDEGKKMNADTLFDREKEKIKENADAMQEYIKKMEEQWKLYRSLLEKSGGKKEFASLAFNDNGKIWDETAKQMLEKFNERGNELGVIPVSFHWDMNEDELKDALVDSEGQVQTELVKLAQKIQSIIRANYNRFLEDSAEAYSKSIKTTEKLVSLRNQLDEKIKERDQYNGNDNTIIKGFNIQISALAKQVKEQEAKVLEESSDYVRFFGAILSMTSDEAEIIGQKIRQNLVQQMKDGVISAKDFVKGMKNIDSQLNKLRKGKNFFEAFKSGSFKGVADLKLEIATDELTDASEKAKKAEEDLENARLKAAEATTDAEKAEAQENVYKAQANKEEADKNLGTATTNYKAAVKNQIATTKFGSALSAIAMFIQMIVGAYEEVKSAAAAFGEDMDADLSTFGQHFMGIMEGLNKGLSKIQQGDIGGGITAMVFGSIASIAQKHDATLKQDIEASQRLAKTFENSMTLLGKKLDGLMGGIDELKISQEERNNLYKYIGVTNPDQQKTIRDFLNGNFKIEDAKELMSALFYKSFGRFKDSLDQFEAKTDTDKAVVKAIQSEQYFDMAYANLLIQRDELKRQLEDQEDMKNKDEDKILDLKEQIAELEIDIDNFAKDMAEKLYGIDFKGWASQLAEALVSAWAAGESGAEAYKKKVSEILRDLAVKMITEKILLQKLDPIMNDFLKQYEEDGGVLTNEGMSIISRMFDLAEDFETQTNDFMDGLNEEARKRGYDLKDSSSSSSTSSSIQGITEQTADILASYINAIRADVSVNRTMIAQYYPQFLNAVGQVSVLSQTQVTLQTQIASNTLRNADAADKIFNLLHGIAPDGTYVRMK